MGKSRNIPEDAETVEEGLSNEVYFHNDKVYKLYRFFPVPGLYASLLELFRGRLIFFSRNRRIRNELKMSDLVGNNKVKTAEVLDIKDKTIVFEKVPGVSGFNYLSQCSDEEAFRLGQNLKEFLEDIHDKDVAIKDCRLSNFIIDDETIYSIDHEYASLEAGTFFKILDELTLLSSARQTTNYHSFKDGFEPHKYAVFLSIFTAVYHIILFDQELDRLRNLFNSLKNPKQN